MSQFQKAPVEYPDPQVPVVAVRRPPGQVAKYHQHTDADWEFCYVRTGEAQFRVAGARWHLHAGDLLTIRPDEPHACLAWQGRRMVLIFHQQLFRTMPLRVRIGTSDLLEVEGVAIPRLLSIAPPDRPTVEYLLDRLEQECFGERLAKGSMCVALLALLLLAAARSVGRADTNRQPRLTPTARAVLEDFCEEVRNHLDFPWALEDLAQRSGYSVTHLTFLFRQMTGLSPCQWLCEQRVRQACALLAESESSITEIALEVGFGSRSQFHRAFRRVMGTTPDRYRAIARHEAQPQDLRHSP